MASATERQVPAPMVQNNHDLWHELMDFYTYEARLLDERRFHEWLDLLADDLYYFMPRRMNVFRRDLDKEFSKPGEMAIFEENKKSMLARVMKLDTGMAWSEDPPSRTRHLVGNLIVEPQENGEVKAQTAFIIHKSHLETDLELYSGSRDDVLRRTDSGLQVFSRTIKLDANVLLSKNLTIFF